MPFNYADKHYGEYSLNPRDHFIGHRDCVLSHRHISVWLNPNTGGSCNCQCGNGNTTFAYNFGAVLGFVMPFISNLRNCNWIGMPVNNWFGGYGIGNMMAPQFYGAGGGSSTTKGTGSSTDNSISSRLRRTFKNESTQNKTNDVKPEENNVNVTAKPTLSADKANELNTELEALQGRYNSAINSDLTSLTGDALKNKQNEIETLYGDLKAFSDKLANYPYTDDAQGTLGAAKKACDDMMNGLKAKFGLDDNGKFPKANSPESKTEEMSLKAFVDNIKSLDALSKATIPDNLTQKQAFLILRKIEPSVFTDNKYNTLKFYNDYNYLILASKTGYNVNVATNPNASDKWIKGRIENVKKDPATGKISFDVNCRDVKGALFEYKYSFNAIDNSNSKYTISNIDKNGSNKVGYVVNDYDKREYEFSQEYLTFTGDPLISPTKDENNRKAI